MFNAVKLHDIKYFETYQYKRNQGIRSTIYLVFFF